MLGFLAQSLKATMCPEKKRKVQQTHPTLQYCLRCDGRSPSRGQSTLQWTEKGPHCWGHHQLPRLCFPKRPSLSSSLGSLCRPTPLYCVLLSTRLPLTPLSDLVSDPLTWEWKYLTTCSRVLFPAFSGTESLVSVSHTCILQCSSLENICTPVIWLTFPHKHPSVGLCNIFIHHYIELQGRPTHDIRESFVFFYS